MLPLGLEDAVRRYGAVARPILLRFFPPASCIQSSRACAEVFKQFGFQARVQPVQMVVTNHDTKVAWVAGLSEQSKAHAMAVAEHFVDLSSDAGWNDGHLVTIVERRWFVDSALDQVQSVNLPKAPFAFRMPPGFSLRRHRIDIDAATDEGTPINIQYAHSGNHGYLKHPAWHEGLVAVPAIKRAMMSGQTAPDELPMFVIYEDAPDQRYKYVVRRWVVRDGQSSPDRQVWGVAKDAIGLDILRASLEREGYVRTAWRGESPPIKEVWA